MRFTDLQIKRLQAKAERYDIREGGGEGFGIRVSPSGHKTWLFFYDFDGRRRRMTLGIYPEVSLKDAREKHGDALKLLRNGTDPATLEAEKKLERRLSPTMEELVQEYIEKWAKPRKKTWGEDKRSLEKDVIPAWGKRKAKDITKRDVILLLEGVVERGAPVQANNLFEKIRKMFNFAVERDILQHSPCQGVRPLTQRTPKERNLALEEIRTLWPGLDKAAMSEETRRALKLILVTAQRPGEVVGLHSSEIHGQWWTIPTERAKNKRPHRVFLTPMALELIGKKEGFIFESPKGGKPIDVNALAFALRRSLKVDEETKTAKLPMEHFTPHDLRRTAASQMAALGFGVIVDKVLNHTDRRVTAIYDRYGYDKEKQTALEAWSRKLEGMIKGANQSNVISLAR